MNLGMYGDMADCPFSIAAQQHEPRRTTLGYLLAFERLPVGNGIIVYIGSRVGGVL